MITLADLQQWLTDAKYAREQMQGVMPRSEYAVDRIRRADAALARIEAGLAEEISAREEEKTPPQRSHTKIVTGKCPVCGHYGEDCTGTPKSIFGGHDRG